MSYVNKPAVSRIVAWMYGALVIFIAAVITFFVYAALFTPMVIVAAIGVSLVELIILSILRSLYTTKYILTDKELIIKTTKLIGGNKRIPLDTIDSVEKILIPLGVKLFGASFHGGYYHIPNLGRAFLAITNFNDGLLIKTKDANYIITPKDPVDFLKDMKQS